VVTLTWPTPCAQVIASSPARKLADHCTGVIARNCRHGFRRFKLIVADLSLVTAELFRSNLTTFRGNSLVTAELFRSNLTTFRGNSLTCQAIFPQPDRYSGYLAIRSVFSSERYDPVFLLETFGPLQRNRTRAAPNFTNASVTTSRSSSTEHHISIQQFSRLCGIGRSHDSWFINVTRRQTYAHVYADRAKAGS
jgi:hypothetical protein